jgi:2-polyprenyl-6-methoxyphenol hydroxylase-like FAD-dependent oxidoreductase
MTEDAVVLGGGMAGLLAARVLAGAYRQVTLVERDRLPADLAGHRRGVPQGHHAHGLLARGQLAMEHLLPGLTGELTGHGAQVGDLLDDVRWYLRGRRLRQAPVGLRVVSASRPLLEGVVRARVRALPNVTILDGWEVAGLASSPRGRVIGARVLRRDDLTARRLPADLVVDATGRGSRTPRWLAEMGFRAPEEERLPIGLGYATRLYRAPADALDGDLAAVIARYPGQRRSGILQHVEGDRWLLSLAGIQGDHPPVDPDGFLAFAGTLAAPDAYRLAASAQPLTEAVTFRFPAYLRRRYEWLDTFPAGLLVLGDAVCSFNPVYAQGMSVAALGALTLAGELAHGEPRADRYFHALAGHLETPWGIAVSGDLAVAGGRPGLRARMIGGYLGRLQRAAADDEVLARAFVRVSGLVDPPARLLRPRRALRVLGHALRRPRCAAPGPAEKQVLPSR